MKALFAFFALSLALAAAAVEGPKYCLGGADECYVSGVESYVRSWVENQWVRPFRGIWIRAYGNSYEQAQKNAENIFARKYGNHYICDGLYGKDPYNFGTYRSESGPHRGQTYVWLTCPDACARYRVGWSGTRTERFDCQD